MHLKLNNEKLQDNLNNERRNLANTLSTTTQEQELLKRENSEIIYLKEKEINELT